MKGLARGRARTGLGERLVSAGRSPRRRVPITAIPYYAWDNRKAGADEGLAARRRPRTPARGGLEARAKVSLSFVSGNCQPWGINDGLEPKSSGEQPAALCHWWPHRARREWAQYTWKKPVTLKGAKVYWFDDTGRGACRCPLRGASNIATAKTGSRSPRHGGYPVTKDGWCEVHFAPVKTTALRLSVQLQEGWAAGVHEWKLEELDDD